LLGYIQSDSSNPTHTSTNLYDIYPALYLQDNYKMTRNLTINLGVRWDYFQPYTQANDLYADIYLSGKLATTVATPQAGSLYGRGSSRATGRMSVLASGSPGQPTDHSCPRRLRHLLHDLRIQRLLRRPRAVRQSAELH
jgi:outer membrane receptor protein involved in Fe transport